MSVVQNLDTRELVGLDPEKPSPRAALALRDIADGLGKSWIWMALAWQDTRARYRGSILGPGWFTMSTLIMVVMIGAIYSRLLHAELGHYIPFLLTGLVLWQFVSNVITESCQTFGAVRSVILQVPMPFSIHVFRVVCRNLLALAHTIVLVPIAIVLFQVPVNWHTLLFPLGLFVLTLNGLWVSLLLGMTAARFADVQPIVASLLQLVFFVTPIFWSADALGRWGWVAECNPLFAVIDIARSALLGTAAAPYSWFIALLTLVLGGGFTFAVFARFRTRITYWI
jgi:ABC-2 type transport system permease protein/lipopolysaccharide transport system permease protein